jgi:queuine tRNA-ribosyltransferase
MKKVFSVTAVDPASSARAGFIHTSHGKVPTPAFAPVASQGTVKALTHEQVLRLGAKLLLVNAYHLFLRPGVETVAAMGGLHAFMNWKKPILSDSGGFQIYSLSPLAKVSREGVRFTSHLDGAKIKLTPEDVVDIQMGLGSDIMMALDYFVPYPASREKMKEAVEILGHRPDVLYRSVLALVAPLLDGQPRHSVQDILRVHQPNVPLLGGI